jgi:hypothetical protein
MACWSIWSAAAEMLDGRRFGEEVDDHVRIGIVQRSESRGLRRRRRVVEGSPRALRGVVGRRMKSRSSRTVVGGRGVLPCWLAQFTMEGIGEKSQCSGAFWVGGLVEDMLVVV